MKDFKLNTEQKEKLEHLEDDSGFLVKTSTLAYLIEKYVNEDREKYPKGGILASFHTPPKEQAWIVEQLDDTAGTLLSLGTILGVIQRFVNEDRSLRWEEYPEV